MSRRFGDELSPGLGAQPYSWEDSNMANSVQILQKYWTEHPAWFGGSYGEYLHLGGNQQMLRLLLRDVPTGPETRVIDLSCALGGNARWLAALYGCSVEGVDAFRPALQAARELAKAQGLAELCKFTVAKPEQLPHPDKSFDLAVTAEGEVHWPEVSRVCKPNGAVIGSTVVVGDKAELFAEVEGVGLRIEYDLDVTNYAKAFYRSKEEEAKLLVQAGLMSEADMHLLQMHTVDLYEAGSAAHILFRFRRP